jgi:hypothetical protein
VNNDRTNGGFSTIKIIELFNNKVLSSYTVSYSRFTMAYPQEINFITGPLGRKTWVVIDMNQ